MRTIKVIFTLALLGVFALGVYVYSGAYNVGADVPHTRLVHWLAGTVRERSVKVHAEGITVPPLDAPDMISKGAGHYAAMCSGCHLAPGYDSSEISAGLYPQPPKLAKGVDMPPARIFWVLKHGIKMSGMPAWGGTHSDDDLWAITAFVMQLPKLSAEQYRSIVATAPPDDDMVSMPMPGGTPTDDQH